LQKIFGVVGNDEKKLKSTENIGVSRFEQKWKCWMNEIQNRWKLNEFKGFKAMLDNQFAICYTCIIKPRGVKPKESKNG
jgi:predicted phosphoadenosine phosphosulfate sulfurtransferase